MRFGLFLLLASPALAEPAVDQRAIGFVLPSRHVDPLLAACVARVAGLLGRPPLAVPEGTADVSAEARLARQRFSGGAVDEAAARLDRAIALGSRMPHRLAGGADLVSAHVLRASIALARVPPLARL